tara:strand:+ start:304 stop:840 length:537 start_codon:yes stop_codon:yes gene_type:complete
MFDVLPAVLQEHIEFLANNLYIEKMKPCAPVTDNPFNEQKPCIPSAEIRPVNVPIPHEIKAVYERYSNDTEFSVQHGDWIFLSEHEIATRQTAMIMEGQTRFVDIAISDAGLGHVHILSYDTQTKMVFTAIDGGCSRWHKASNHKARMQLNSDTLSTAMPFETWWFRFQGGDKKFKNC